MQARAVRRLIVTGVVFAPAAVILPRSSWFLNWHNTLTGGTFTIAQAHAFCSNPLVQAVTIPGSTQANDCATASDWSTFFTLLLVGGIGLLIVAAYKIYRRYNREHSAPRNFGGAVATGRYRHDTRASIARREYVVCRISDEDGIREADVCAPGCGGTLAGDADEVSAGLVGGTVCAEGWVKVAGIGRTDLPLLVTDRGVLAAEAADDPIRIAVGEWNLGWSYASTSDCGAGML
jgi:hypothetical protein